MKAPTNMFTFSGVRFRPPEAEGKIIISAKGGEEMVYTFKCGPARIVMIRFGGRVWTYSNKAATAMFG